MLLAIDQIPDGNTYLYQVSKHFFLNLSLNQIFKNEQIISIEIQAYL